MKPALSAAAALVLSATLAAQTAIKPPKNKYKPEDDVKLGREAAAEVRKQMPVIENGQINDYLARIGRELVAQAGDHVQRRGQVKWPAQQVMRLHGNQERARGERGAVGIHHGPVHGAQCAVA